MVAQCRDLNKLHPFVRRITQSFLDECKKQGLNIGISETYRTVERQDYLYAQGRTRSGSVVTNAKGNNMSSYHQWGLAFDIYNNVKGDEYNIIVLNKAGEIGQKMGLEWGGTWLGFKDKPHFQYTFGLSIADLKKGKTPISVETKDNVTIAKEVLLGKWGNGLQRKQALEKAGYNYIDIQKEVNKLLKG